MLEMLLTVIANILNCATEKKSFFTAAAAAGAFDVRIKATKHEPITSTNFICNFQ